jgi:hypothetical protein
MRIVILPVLVLSLGCASLARPSIRSYRVSGTGATLTPQATKDGEIYLLRLDEGVEYEVQAVLTAGMLRLRTVLRNDGDKLAQYDLWRTVVAAADGTVLRLRDTTDDSSSRPTVAGGAPGDDPRGVRTIAPGQQHALVRNYVLAEGMRRSSDLQLLARVALADVVRVGEREVPVRLRLEEIR